MRPSRPIAVLAAAAACLLGPLPAGVAVAATGPEQTVTVYLQPHDRAGLVALAHATGLTWQQRQAALAAIEPTAAERAEVVQNLSGMGYTVTGQHTWQVSAKAPASLIHATFGSARLLAPRSSLAHALPAQPAALRGLITTAVGGDETRQAAFPEDWTSGSTPPNPAYNGTQLRAAYRMSRSLTGHGEIVATLQLSDFNPDNLVAYADQEGLPDPLTDGQFTGVAVDGGPDNTAGDIEVDLDQETILGVAPGAKQRAYFMPQNDSFGDPLMDGFYAVADDAMTPSIGNRLTAVSTSWSTCEDPSQPGYFQAFEDALDTVLASGVTIFAASGDSGSNCRTGASTYAADTASYPASSPAAIAVGGTSLTDPGNVGGTQSETSWGCGGVDGPCSPDAATYCQMGGCSGGGVSVLFPRPEWQAHARPAATHRVLPDLSMIADPRTGYGIYEAPQGTDPVSCGAPCTMEVGGTSLASPAAAAMLADELAAAGHTWGVGDIHAALYAAPSGDFTDIADGQSNGSFTATAGFDLVTGLGTPHWDSLVGTASAPGPLLRDRGAIAAALGGSHQLEVWRAGHYTNLGGVGISRVTTFSRYGIDYFVMLGTNHLVYIRSTTTSWRAVVSHGYCLDAQGGMLGASFAATCLGSNHQAYLAVAPIPNSGLPAASSWVSLAGGFTSAPAPALVDGFATLIGTGTNSHEYESQLMANSQGQAFWTKWAELGYACLSSPALASVGSATLFACTGLNHGIYAALRTGTTWPGSTFEGGYSAFPPAVALSGSRVGAVFLTGGTAAPHQLYEREITPTRAGAWSPLGGVLTSGPGATETTS